MEKNYITFSSAADRCSFSTPSLHTHWMLHFPIEKLGAHAVTSTFYA